MRYIPPFDRIKARLRINETKSRGRRVNADYDDILRLIHALLVGIEVDETWYLARNEDVARGIQEGKVISAKQHFLDHGYFEGRAPFPIAVDEAWYLANNADVAEEVRSGTFPSGQAHFDAAGYYEGRLPRPM